MRVKLLELIAVFLKLGIIGFGGPAAHIAMMEREVVQRRRWLTAEDFLDIVGATNLIPGPNSTEMAMQIGYRHAGRAGLVLAGGCFLAPAIMITTGCAWVYVTWGQLPQVAPLLAGIKPAVVAIIVTALWRLGKKALGRWALGVLAMAVAVASLSGISEVTALLAGSLVGMLRWRFTTKRDKANSAPGAATIGFAIAGVTRHAQATTATIAAATTTVATTTAAATSSSAVSLLRLALFFLKVGAILYGSGYVLIAYVEGEVVDTNGWLTRAELVDAVAIGQFTPGPILSTATFIGYVVMARDGGTGAGIGGAVIASCAIFLPSFLFVAAVGPLIPRLRRSPWTAALLDAVNAASVGLMAAVTLVLCRDAVADWRGLLILAAGAAAVFRWNINSVWIVLGGAAVGWLLFGGG